MKIKKALSCVLAFAMIMTCISFTPITPRVKAASEPDYLTFTSDEAFSVTLNKDTDPNNNVEFYLQYSTDKENWGNWDLSAVSAEKNGDGKYVIYLRNETGKTNTSFCGIVEDDGDCDYYQSTFSFNSETQTGIAASGNIMTILNYENLSAATLGDAAFYSLFENCELLTSAPELPAKVLAERCYKDMFDDCSNLKTAPKLPATTLADYCYNEMFDHCYSLQVAPKLPATTLADRCYSEMFRDCYSLQVAPKLPATTLADYCYEEMFDYCISLVIAPELKATTLADGCYSEMFEDCSHLYIKETDKLDESLWIIPATDNEITRCVDEMADYTYPGSDYINISEDEDFYYTVVGKTSNLSYSSSEKSIIATCGCDYCNSGEYKLKVSITLNAPDMDYTGNAYDKAAVENKNVWEAVGLKTPEIEYYKLGEANALACAPTAVGKYKAEITYTYGDTPTSLTVSDDFEIKKLDNTISDFTCDDITSDNTPNPLATAVSGRLTYTYSDSDDGTYKEDWNEVFTEPGTYYVKATSEETDKYKSKSETISFNVLSACNYEKECTIENGIFNLILGGNVYGPVKLTKSGEGWAIYSVDLQKYIYWDGSNVTYSDTAYVWNYNNGFYITKTTTEKRWWRSITTKKSYYLSYDENNLSVASKAVNATLTQSKQDKGHTCLCRDNGDGKHTLYCVNCGEVIQTSDCVYGENGLCMFCNHLDPSCVSFDVAVSVSSKTTKATGWARFFSRSSRTTYTAKITATCTGDDLETVEYSVDNVNYKKGMTYSNSSEITTLYIRVTAANGASKTYLYQDGETTLV